MAALSKRLKRKVVSADNKIREKCKQDLTFVGICIKLFGKIKYPENHSFDFLVFRPRGGKRTSGSKIKRKIKNGTYSRCEHSDRKAH